jgi:hypothetical protein
MDSEDWLVWGALVLAAGLSFLAVDCVGVPTSSAGVGTVQDRQWMHSWWETRIDTDSKGKTSSHMIYHDDEYYLLITFEDRTSKYSVDAHRYGTSRQGSPIEMLQWVGRITGHRYVTAGSIVSDGHGGGW